MMLEKPQMLSDDALLCDTSSLAQRHHALTAELLAYIAEVDRRRLYRREACASMHSYCTERLHLSDGAAYKRIHAARAARKFPILFEMVQKGEIHLKGITLLAPHLSEENHRELLSKAKYKPVRAIEKLVAEIVPRPDVPARVRAVPYRAPGAVQGPAAGERVEACRVQDKENAKARHVPDRHDAKREPHRSEAVSADVGAPQDGQGPSSSAQGAGSTQAPSSIKTAASNEVPSSVQVSSSAQVSGSPQAPSSSQAPRENRVRKDPLPLSRRRYEIRVTVGEETYADLKTLQGLLGHQIPDGSPEAIISRALALLVERTLARKAAVTQHPKATHSSKQSSETRSRYIPAPVRRRVWLRDEGRCAFTDAKGRRCSSTRRIEFHHLDNWAQGAEHDPERLELRCRTHNAYQAEIDYGEAFMQRKSKRGRAREARAPYAAIVALRSGDGTPGLVPRNSE